MATAVTIARENLLADKVKFLFAVGGVTLAILLILVVQSLYEGVRRDTVSFIRDLPGDIWVVQDGTTDLAFSNSFLTESDSAEVAEMTGVASVHRLYGRLTDFETDGGNDDTRVYIWALAPGGPLTAEEQRTIPEPGTIIVDRSLAKRADLSIGDSVEFEGEALTVADIDHVGNVLVAQFAFVHPDDYSRIMGFPGAANFFLVTLGPDAPDDISTRVDEAVDRSDVLTTEEFVSVVEESTRNWLPVIRVIGAISFIVGLAVLSLTIYSATIERAREYGIMKVLGASPLHLYRIVLSQSAIIALLGFSAGLALAFLFNRVAGDVVPQFVTYIRWQDVALVLGVAALMTFVASFLPINRVARVDPASVFRT